MLESPYSYWQRIYGRKLYDTEQLQVADQVIDLIERVYPGLRAEIEVADVATPLSYERYTGNWQGATCGFLLTKETMRLMLLGVTRRCRGWTTSTWPASGWSRAAWSPSPPCPAGRRSS